MIYVYKNSTKEVVGGVYFERDLEVYLTNFTDVSSIEVDARIPKRFKGFWIINSDGQLENITT